MPEYVQFMTQDDRYVDDRCKGLHERIYLIDDHTRPKLPIYTYSLGHKHRQCRCYYRTTKTPWLYMSSFPKAS